MFASRLRFVSIWVCSVFSRSLQWYLNADAQWRLGANKTQTRTHLLTCIKKKCRFYYTPITILCSRAPTNSYDVAWFLLSWESDRATLYMIRTPCRRYCLGTNYLCVQVVSCLYLVCTVRPTATTVATCSINVQFIMYGNKTLRSDKSSIICIEQPYHPIKSNVSQRRFNSTWVGVVGWGCLRTDSAAVLCNC